MPIQKLPINLLQHFTSREFLNRDRVLTPRPSRQSRVSSYSSARVSTFDTEWSEGGEGEASHELQIWRRPLLSTTDPVSLYPAFPFSKYTVMMLTYKTQRHLLSEH